MGPVLLHAASFDENIKHIILLQSPLSYRSIVMNEFHKIPFSSAVPGAQTAYDLPDLLACTSPCNITLSESRDYLLEPESEGAIKQELTFPISMYSLNNVPDNLVVFPPSVSMDSIVNLCFK